MTARTWMLYGANGYTGRLIIEAAAARGDTPLLAGRSEDALRPLAESFGLPYRTFSLDDPAALARQLEDVDAVLLAAGPFSRTSRPVVDACLATGTHYLDITGEIPVFEACHARTDEARQAGCALIPGVGFDVVPSDCLAATLAEALPGATSLELAFCGVGAPSRGTAKTMLEGIPEGGAVRTGGAIRRVPLAYATAEIPFADKPRQAVSIPWGDVSTAYYSTGIGDIIVYMAMPPKMIRLMKLARPVARLLGAGPVQRLLSRRIDRGAAGPNAETRRAGRSQLWGRVRGPGGREVTGTLTTPEAYHLTALTATESVRRVLAGAAKAGALTPSMAFGASFITEFEGCALAVSD